MCVKIIEINKDNTLFDDLNNDNFLFSIIMGVYNSQDFLRESIDSVINQSLNFIDNIQLILVDDGSSDNSLEILYDYERLYPSNIIVLSQENKGQSTARNYGLKYATGKYINFLDSDDYYSTNLLENVYDIFLNNSKINLVSAPLVYVDRIQGEDPLNNNYSWGNILNLNKNPNSPFNSLNTFFIKSNYLKSLDIEFNINLIFSEDFLFLNQLLSHENEIGLVSSSNYYFRHRYDFNAIHDEIYFKKQYYNNLFKESYLKLIDFCMFKYNKVPLLVQYNLLYNLGSIANLYFFLNFDKIF